jgi:hypothetical protein
LRAEFATPFPLVIPRESGKSNIPETPNVGFTAAAPWIVRIAGDDAELVAT